MVRNCIELLNGKIKKKKREYLLIKVALDLQGWVCFIQFEILPRKNIMQKES